jgi:hypothetical protein
MTSDDDDDEASDDDDNNDDDKGKVCSGKAMMMARAR